jgi:hypothetical protein
MRESNLSYKPGGAPVYAQAADENRRMNRESYED